MWANQNARSPCRSQVPICPAKRELVVSPPRSQRGTIVLLSPWLQSLARAYIDVSWLKWSDSRHPSNSNSTAISISTWISERWHERANTVFGNIFQRTSSSLLNSAGAFHIPNSVALFSSIFLPCLNPLSTFFVTFIHLASLTLSSLLSSRLCRFFCGFFFFPLPSSLPSSASQKIYMPLGKDSPLVGGRE